MRIKIVLACDECHKRNYTVKKNKLTHPERMEVKKYCSKCSKHTIHKETK